MTDVRPDVLVLGGGPAGSAAALLLSRWGHRVILRTRPPATGPRLAESIPPSTRRLFDVLGVRAAIDNAGFVRSTGNTVWWGSDAPRVERFAGGERGWQATTAALEDALRPAVVDAGVVVEIARVDAASASAFPAAFTLDCTGRAGAIARARGLRTYDTRLRTVALVGLWRAPQPMDVPDITHTLIESYEGGWAWSVPVSASDRYLAVMVDPKTSGLAHDTTARAVYLGEIAKTKRLAAIVQRAALVDGPAGWDASMYHATRYVDGDALLVGDAGSFVDPLSSAGVKKALASGWLAAVAVHTSLLRPAMRGVALDFFAAREAEVYASFRAMTERFLAEAAKGHAHPFWSDRTETNGSADDSAAVAAAFAHLRAQRELRVVRDNQVQVEPRPAVNGIEIVLEQRLVSASHPAGLRYAFDVDLLALLEIAPRHASVPAAFEAYTRQHGPVALPDFLGALSIAIAEKWLRWV